MTGRGDLNATEAIAGASLRTLDAEALARILMIDKATLYRHLSSGRIGPLGFRIGRCRRWLEDEIRQWLEAGAPPRRIWLERK